MTLDVQTRESGIRGNVLRAKNLIPAEYYGSDVKNQSLQIDYNAFRRLFRKAGKNTLVELNVDGKKKFTSLVHDIQYHPVTDQIIHVDFINVQMDKVIHARIPLKFFGVAPAVKELGGILTHTMHEVDVKCLPKDLIPSIEVSVESIVSFHSYVRVKDLNVPFTITILNSPNDVVVTAVAPKAEEEEAPVAAAATPEAGAAVVAGAEAGAAGAAAAVPAAPEVKPKK